jgi:exodeoxyribonuclease VII large subunit
VLIHPVSVQGAQAAPEIVAALARAQARGECDVLILARGGGSIEDLWAFNDERVARAIVASPVPVITGIGHEVDFTIADFAADARAPTPSVAAEMAVPDAAEWLAAAGRLAGRLERGARRHLAERRERLRWLAGRAAQVSPVARLGQQAQRLDELDQRLVRAASRTLHGSGERLSWLRGRLWRVSPLTRVRELASRREAMTARLEAAGVAVLRGARERLLPLVRTLHAVSPLATLDRGYAIVADERGKILRDAAEAVDGEIIEARLAVGRIRARVQRS